MARANGQELNIAINPRGNKDLEDEEKFAPLHLDIRNGHLTDIGDWVKRPGYSELYDTSSKYAINLLIDRSTGYVGNENGQLYKIGGGTVTALEGVTYGSERPTWDEFEDRVIICAGAQTVKIQDDIVEYIETIPEGFKYIARIGPYTLYSKGDNIVYWSQSLNPETVEVASGGGFFLTQQRGGVVRNIKAVKDTLFVFMDRQVEIWINIGGTAVFVKQDRATVNSGTTASHSVVEANDTFYFYGDDNKFYAITGQGAKDISKSYTKDIDEIVHPEQMYGIHFKKERLIRWFEPIQGKCYVYDYVHDVFSEDNTWSHGQFERMPINSYMELKNRAYIGDYDPVGLVHEWSPEHNDDDGKPIRVFRKFAVKPSESNRVRFNRLRFRVKRGVGDYGSTPFIQYKYRIDKGDWSVLRTVDLGARGDHNPFIRAQGSLGIGREIEFELYVTDSVDYTLTGMFLNVRELEN